MTTRRKQNGLGSLFGESADADDPFWLQNADDFAQMGVTGGFEFSSGSLSGVRLRPDVSKKAKGQ